MTVARSVTDVLTEHVLFEIDCVDRLYCNVYVPQLQYAAGLVGYVHRQLALPIASTAPLARITEALDKAVHRFARDHRVAELAEQPYFWNELDVRLINYAGYRRRLAGLKAWRQALEGIAQEAEAHEAALAAGQGDEGDERRPPLPAAARAREAAEHFAAFADRAGALDAARTLRDWLGWLQQFLHDDPWDMQRRLWRVPARRWG